MHTRKHCAVLRFILIAHDLPIDLRIRPSTVGQLYSCRHAKRNDPEKYVETTHTDQIIADDISTAHHNKNVL